MAAGDSTGARRRARSPPVRALPAFGSRLRNFDRKPIEYAAALGGAGKFTPRSKALAPQVLAPVSSCSPRCGEAGYQCTQLAHTRLVANKAAPIVAALRVALPNYLERNSQMTRGSVAIACPSNAESELPRRLVR